MHVPQVFVTVFSRPQLGAVLGKMEKEVRPALFQRRTTCKCRGCLRQRNSYQHECVTFAGRREVGQAPRSERPPRQVRNETCSTAPTCLHRPKIAMFAAALWHCVSMPTDGVHDRMPYVCRHVL